MENKRGYVIKLYVIHVKSLLFVAHNFSWISRVSWTMKLQIKVPAEMSCYGIPTKIYALKNNWFYSKWKISKLYTQKTPLDYKPVYEH